MQVLLEAIKFNHDPASATTDAFNIRKNDTEPVLFPEWQRGTSFTAEDSLAAYAIAQTRGHGISIKAKFKRSDPDITTIEVQAVDASPPLSMENVLGRVEKAEVTFADNGESDFVTFLLQDVRLDQRGVGKSKNVWRWQFRVPPDSIWTDFAKTVHRIYSVLDVPQAPWSQDVSSGDNSQLPWTEVLDVACDWAASAQDANQAAELITRNAYDLGYGFVTYDGASSSYAQGNFNCTDFLKLLRGQDGMGKTVNCSDCATIVTSFANILGCRTWEVDLFPGFLTNPIIVIGESTPRQFGFVAHEVTLTGDTLDQAAVFDACLQVDGDQNPTPSSTQFDALLPTNLPFGLANEHNYRFRVASANNIEPSIEHRHRRKIGNRVAAKFVDLDPRFIESLKEQYLYESWRELPPSEIGHLNVPAFIGSSLRQGWLHVDTYSQNFVDNTRLTQLLWKSPSLDPEVLVRVELFECPGWPEARALLLRLLGEFRSTPVKRLEDPGFADVAFTATDNASVLFVYREWVVLIRSAGTKTISLRESISVARAEALFNLRTKKTDTFS